MDHIKAHHRQKKNKLRCYWMEVLIQNKNTIYFLLSKFQVRLKVWEALLAELQQIFD